MKTDRSNAAALIGGTLLIAFGILSLARQLFRNVVNWSYLWPQTVIVFGALFFAGMFLGGRQFSGLAIPGSIIGGIGLMPLYQNLTSHWESWAYGWTLIIMFVGVGIYILQDCIAATVGGMGSVSYYGNAKVSKNIDGLGSVNYLGTR